MTALDGRTALVTGAAGGIGREVVLLLGRLGANVVVNDPGVHLDGSGGSAGPAEEVAQAIIDEGGSAVPNTDTVATPEGGAAMIQSAVDSFGRIDAVIHAAGILRDRMVFNMATEEWDAVIAVHLAGYFHLVRPASQLMRQQRFGRLIGFSSSSGLIGNSGQANYGAAKAGIAGMTRCLAADLGRYAVTSNAIAPTADTRMTQSVPESARSARSGSGIATLSAQPTQADPAHVAPMVAYLCSDQAWDINGCVFYVGSGKVSIAHEAQPLRSINKPAPWEISELAQLVPTELMRGLANPAPPTS
jgi:NAD(P)-dependent dehydrogenase (short-subunit alcohol dehydrogenase family)